MAQALQPAHQPVPGSVGVQLVEVIAADLSILGAIPQDAESNYQQSMRCGDDRLANSMLARLAVEKGGQIAVLFARGGPSGLAESTPQPAIPFASPIAKPLPAALMIAGAQPRPTGSMPGTGEDAHVRAEFRQNGPGRNEIDTGNAAESRRGFQIHARGKHLLQAEDLALYELQIFH